jgi:signal transduction histidine kinase
MAASSSLPSRLRLAPAPRLRPAYPVVLAMFVATVSFAISLWYSHSLLLPLDERALTIIENSLPSVEHLAQARLALMQIARQLERMQSLIGAERSAAAQQLETARQSLAAELQRYRALPPSPDESRLLPGLDAELARLNLVIVATRRNSTASPEDFSEPLARAAALLERLELLNADEVLSSGSDMLRLRRRTAKIAMLLGLSSLAVASGALLMALIVLRGQARLMDQHAAVLAERGAELEAFSGRVAHDLRDPLSAMALGIQMANKSSDVAARPGQVLDLIARQVARMNDIIEGLLEFARAGASPAPGAHANLTLILHEVVDTLRPKAVAAQAELSIDPLDPIEVACTPAALGSVIANLVGNAVKYIVESPHATRHIRILVKERGELVRIEIVDNGPGLPPAAEQLVFEPFWRMRETKQPGIGLGLATVKKIVEAYRGRVGVSSRLGHGSTFWFELPIAAGKQERAAARS